MSSVVPSGSCARRLDNMAWHGHGMVMVQLSTDAFDLIRGAEA